jgi:membrane protease YdiL (CAAX protease family)
LGRQINVSWLVVFVAFTVYYGLSAIINVAGLAAPADNAALMQQIGLASPILFALAIILQSGAVASLLGLVIAFGEEYGWRYYLQNELIKLGKVRGIFLVG